VLRIFALQGLSFGASLVNSIIVARKLGPAHKGIVDLFILLNSLVLSFGLFSIGTGLLYHLANKGRPLKEVHGTALLFVLVAGGVTVVAGYLGLSLWSMFFPGLPKGMILLAFAIAPFAYYREIWAYIALGCNWAVALYQVSFFFTLANLLLTSLLWLIKWLDAPHFVNLTATLLVVQAGVCFVLLYRREPHLTASATLAWQSFRYGLIAQVGATANLLHFRIDQLMINRWLGTADVGIYAVGVRFTEMLLLLESPISAATLQKVSSFPASDSYQLTRRLSWYQLIINGGAGLALSAAAYPMIRLLYGRAYQNAVLPLILLVPGVVAWAAARASSQYISYNQGKIWIPAVFSVIGAVVNIGLNLFLVIRLGIAGAAIASSVSYTVVAILTVSCFRRCFKTSELSNTESKKAI
jgi:O-antigen/teichoic acid export membrane protein